MTHPIANDARRVLVGRRTRHASTISLLGLICANGAAEAQLLRRENFTLSMGVVYYRSGARENNGPEAGGVSVGFDFQTALRS